MTSAPCIYLAVVKNYFVKNNKLQYQEVIHIKRGRSERGMGVHEMIMNDHGAKGFLRRVVQMTTKDRRGGQNTGNVTTWYMDDPLVGQNFACSLATVVHQQINNRA